MGILNGAANALSLGFLGSTGVVNPVRVSNDFEGGFQFTEIIDGKEDKAGTVSLIGPFMPHQPFNFGGTQQLVKNYYAGSAEPTVQVLGPREKDTVLKGRFKSKRLKDANLREAAREYQMQIDELRKRGNLIRFSLGNEWVRYGFIEEVEFDLDTLAEISYSVRLFIVGDTVPTNCKFVDEGANNIEKPNTDLKSAIENALAEVNNIPEEMPQTIADQLNSLISGAAGVLSTVTDFVDGVVGDANSLLASANRALGLIKYARAYVSSTVRTLGAMSLQISSLGSNFSSESEKTAATIKNVDAIYRNRVNFIGYQALLVSLQAQFAALAKTVPMMRHLVRNGDNLQRLSMRYYNDSELWKKIYDHNKLRTTELTVGSVLEIPRL